MCSVAFLRTWILFVIMAFSGSVFAELAQGVAQGKRQVAGIVLFATGVRDRHHEESDDVTKISRGVAVYVGDQIITGQDGYVQLRMIDNAYLSLKSGSKLTIQAYHADADDPSLERVKLFLEEGVVRSKTGGIGKRNKQKFRLNTPVAAIGVRGTDFSIRTTDSLSQIVVLEGGVAMSPFGESCTTGGLGACEGSQMRELFADSAINRYLELKKGSRSVRLLEGRLDILNPAREEFIPQQESTENEQKEQDQGKRLDNQSLFLSQDFEQLLVEALDREEISTDGASAGPDSDLDGVPDAQDIDQDNDGIANSLERMWLLDPLSADSDRDGVSDLAELRNETNPLNADFDSDGIIDSQDMHPTSPDTIQVSHQRIDKSALATAQVLSDTQAIRTQGSAWVMSIALAVPQNPNPIEHFLTTVSFDATTGVWQGSASDIEVLQALMSGATWADITKQWMLSVLLNADESEAAIRHLVDRWDDTPTLIIEGLDIAVLSSANPDLLENRTYVYHSVSESLLVNDPSAIQVEQAQILELSVDVENKRFDSTVKLPSGEVIEVKGRAEGGVLNGRAQQYSLQGIIADRGSLNVIISDNESSVFSQLSLSNYHSQPLSRELTHIDISDAASVEWGRWSDFARLNERDVTKLVALGAVSGEDFVTNRHFVLMRSTIEGFRVPETGKYSFALSDYDAVHVNNDVISAARVDNASLDIDIPANRFAMYMGVSAAGLKQSELVRAYGSISETGHMQDDNVLSNAEVQGFLGSQAKDAGLLFEKTLGSQEYISGASYWTRKP